jgi:transposase
VPSPKLAPLELTAAERQTLTAWMRRRKTSQSLAMRSRIVLACAGGVAIGAVAAELGVSRDMVSKWRGRFLQDRLEGLTDEPRPGRPRTIGDEQVELVISKTLEERGPGEDTHWSTRSMAAATGMSQSAVSRIWRAFGLKPHLAETWKLSTDPQFIDKVRDIVGPACGTSASRPGTRHTVRTGSGPATPGEVKSGEFRCLVSARYRASAAAGAGQRGYSHSRSAARGRLLAYHSERLGDDQGRLPWRDRIRAT